MKEEMGHLPVDVNEKILMVLYKMRLQLDPDKISNLSDEITTMLGEKYDETGTDIRDVIAATCMAALFLNDLISRKALDNAPDEIKEQLKKLSSEIDLEKMKPSGDEH